MQAMRLPFGGARLGQARRDVVLVVGGHALQAADRHRLGLGRVLFLDPSAPAGRLAGPVAGAAEDAGEHVGHPVDHVGVAVAALPDQADVFGHGGVGGAGPLAIHDLVEVGRIGHVGGLHDRLSPAAGRASASVWQQSRTGAAGRVEGLSLQRNRRAICTRPASVWCQPKLSFCAMTSSFQRWPSAVMKASNSAGELPTHSSPCWARV